ncbi:virulence factor family protein [Phytopseudomonas dryadis]|uniref:Virulence factor family protein n=1 Tax=Phytopseudomonas dryadis TaxID=2487520 RepID=A0ABY1YZG4_9GAMM|nr:MULTISPECIES: AcvB/VirJ family lysyl-phosphatidylglycerol hydrolase [Pseudomonas]TBU99559.1 virulence factor family protein [Pseudomonas dryadis]TBV12656.1 virulence factor family protein [Pseudomonas sp. FRB 230]
MSRTAKYLLPILVALFLLLAGALYYLQRSPSEASLARHPLASGGDLLLATPGDRAQRRVLLALPADQQLSDTELLELARSNHALIGQYPLASLSCDAQAKRLGEAISRLGGQVDLLAGSDAGAMLAWRWLATQNRDQAQALSVGFALGKPDCDAAPPTRSAHGHWLAAWNDNPDDASARFVRQQANAEPLIGDYQTAPKALLLAQLRRLLQGAGDALPVVEVAATQPGDTVSLFYSGDGGWRDLDRAVAEQMAQRGYPVVGVDTLRYFWQRKSPEQAASDLSELMRQYREKWHARRFVLIGYSFGADVMPALYNRLPDSDKQQVDAIVLLALARSGSFEIRVQSWLGQAADEAATGPELAQLPAAKVLCVYGQEEAPESGCTQEQAVGERLQLPGGHHYDKDYPALAQRLIAAIGARQHE